MDTTRTFVAVFPPADVVARIATAIDALRRPGDGVGWVHTPNLHYTLRFLGDLEPERLAAARRAAARAAGECSPFSVRLGAPGLFPDARRPRVLWLGAAEGEGPLTRLAAHLEAALAADGFAPADKPFAPHLTLGRVRDAADGAAVARRFTDAPPPDALFEVRELVVVKSTLDPRGARYEPLARLELGPPA
ncbi:MAG: RNA 2',3'-cyclic phosphodiesterase [Candidatus Eisenbacteria bacterium]